MVCLLLLLFVFSVRACLCVCVCVFFYRVKLSACEKQVNRISISKILVLFANMYIGEQPAIR